MLMICTKFTAVTNHPSEGARIMNRPQTPYVRNGIHTNGDNNHDDSVSVHTISDYEEAWTTYRTQYLAAEILIRNTAREIFHRLTRQQQDVIIHRYGEVLNQVVERLAYDQGRHRMCSEGWGHIIIAPEHRHVSRLPEKTIQTNQYTHTSETDPHHIH